jgi:prepilin-type N-terminal cleavage/methylation domain-containing protein
MLKQPILQARPSGFTLVELLIVMTIILILVSVSVPAVNTARAKAKDTEVKSGVNLVQKALEQYAVDHSGFYPGAQWLQDSSGQYHVGPGIIGALPTYFDSRPQQDFLVAKDAADPRQPYLPDGTPNPTTLDALVTNNYLTDYPANPFIRASGSAKSQMSNLLLFNPILGVSTPDPTNPNTMDWNRYTNNDTGSMRQEYSDLARGHFTYVPLNPVNLTGIDFAGQWNALQPAQLSDFYREAKGLSEKFYSTSAMGFDFDKSLDVDPMERVLTDVTNGGILYREQTDSAGAVGDFGATGLFGGPSIDSAFKGATIMIISGS